MLHLWNSHRSSYFKYASSSFVYRNYSVLVNHFCQICITFFHLCLFAKKHSDFQAHQVIYRKSLPTLGVDCFSRLQFLSFSGPVVQILAAQNFFNFCLYISQYFTDKTRFKSFSNFSILYVSRRLYVPAMSFAWCLALLCLCWLAYLWNFWLIDHTSVFPCTRQWSSSFLIMRYTSQIFFAPKLCKYQRLVQL